MDDEDADYMEEVPSARLDRSQLTRLSPRHTG
jgi:hypothetical protein